MLLELPHAQGLQIEDGTKLVLVRTTCGSTRTSLIMQLKAPAFTISKTAIHPTHHLCHQVPTGSTHEQPDTWQSTGHLSICQKYYAVSMRPDASIPPPPVPMLARGLTAASGWGLNPSNGPAPKAGPQRTHQPAARPIMTASPAGATHWAANQRPICSRPQLHCSAAQPLA